MKVPISSIALKDCLLINRNNKLEYIPLPFKPYILASTSEFPEMEGAIVVKKTLVPEGIPKDYYRIEFESSDDVWNFKKSHGDRASHFLSDSHIEQIFIEKEDFFLDYPHTGSIRVLFYDIEVASAGDGLFPKPLTHPIVCIGYSVWDVQENSKKLISRAVLKDFNRTEMSDERLLEDFLGTIKEFDPDILADYNGTTFDFPYLMQRCEINYLDIARFGRTQKKPYITNDKEDIIISGRIHFDIYNSNVGVKKDQTLFGLKNKKLKELARFYKAPIKDLELKDDIENIIKLYDEDKEKLWAYQEDDVIRTEHVGFVYLRNCIALAEMVKVPLGTVIGMSSSFLPKLLLARNMFKENLINTRSNFSKYNKHHGLIVQLGTRYEGALVGLYKDGFFESLYKCDFSAMYPSCLSKDTEVLTNKGWISVSEMSIQSKLAVVSNDLDVVEYKNPNNVIAEQYKGKMYDIENYDISKVITPNHRIPYYTKRGNFKIDECQNINWDRVNLQVSAKKSGRKPTIIEEQYLGLIPWILTEGNFPTKNRVIISQNYIKNSRYCDRIRYFLKKSKLEFKEKQRKTRPDTEFTIYFPSSIILPFELKREIPEFVFELDLSYRRFFILELMKGDGHKISNSYVFTQKNKSFMDRLQHLCCISGFKATITNEYTDKRNNRKWYYLRISEKQTSVFTNSLKKFKIRKIQYNDLVYCPQFNTGNDSFFIRRKGKVCITKNCIQTFNLGPDTTSLVRVEPYSGRYNCIIEKGYNWYRIPTKFDKGKFQYDLIIKVRNDKEGFIKKEITRLKKERKEIREQLKVCNEQEKDILNSQQTAIKVQNNTIYGILGETNTTYGDMMSAVMVTAMCRWISIKTMQHIGNHVVELDTDGYITNQKVDTEDLNAYLNGLIKEKFNITDNFMRVEQEELGRGFFIAMKTYILQKDGKYIRHGSSIFSSRSAKLVDRVIDLAIQHVFNNKPVEEVLAEAHDFSKLTIDDYVERVKLSREQTGYNDPYCWQVFLAKQVEKRTGQPVIEDTQVSYVITKRQLTDPEFAPYYKSSRNFTFIGNVSDINQLDMNYYHELVDKALKKFGIEQVKQLTMNLEGFEEHIADEVSPFPSGEIW